MSTLNINLKHEGKQPRLAGLNPGRGWFRAERRCFKPLKLEAEHRLDQLSGVAGWRLHDLRRTCVSGMARLGVAPYVADKILNHQAGTISGVAAVYQRHDFLAEHRAALDIQEFMARSVT